MIDSTATENARVLECMVGFPITIAILVGIVMLVVESNRGNSSRTTNGRSSKIGYSNRSGDAGYTTWGMDSHDNGFSHSWHSDCHDGGDSCDGGSDGGDGGGD